MLLNEFATSSDTKIRKINKVLKETFGFTLVSEIKTGTLNNLYTKISDDLYDLKLDLGTVKSPVYMQKVLVLEGLRLLLEKNKLEEGLRAGPGGNAYEKVNKWLTEFVHKNCEEGDEYEEAIHDAMKAYRSSKYRFPDFEVEHDLRKTTWECSPEGVDEYTSASLPMVEAAESCTKCECDPCECDKEDVKEGEECDVCDKCDCDPCECDKEDVKEGEECDVCDKCNCDPCECDKINEVKVEATLRDIKPQNIWWENNPEKLMGYIYWQRSQLPPSGEAWTRGWNKIVKQLSAKFPPPADWVNPHALEEGGDRHAEHDWIKTMKKDSGMDAGPGYEDDTGGLSLLDPEETQQDDADDYFSYRSKQKRNEMKEGYVKQLRKLLEAETDQAESLIAAKSFSQELQEMVEKLGRLVNENLPAVSEQMRDAYGSDVATGFEDQVSNTLNAVMDSLRNSKQEIDNSVSTIADGGAPVSDMDDFSDEELGGEFDDEGLDLEGDVDLDLEVGDELGDEFGGDDAMAGLEDEPLGRAKKEALVVIGKKLVETKAKLARIKARS